MALFGKENPLIARFPAKHGKTCYKCNNLSTAVMTSGETNDTPDNRIEVCNLYLEIYKVKKIGLKHEHPHTLKACGMYADKDYLPI